MIRELMGRKPEIAASAFVSEASYVLGHVEIGENSSIWPGAVLRGDIAKIIIGRNTSVEDNCVVHAGCDMSIGNDVIIGHGAVVHGLRIGNNVLVGNNATILEDVEIGDFCIIGAGSLVTPGTKIPEKSLVMGLPAEVKGRVTAEQVVRLKRGPEFYVALARSYKKQGL